MSGMFPVTSFSYTCYRTEDYHFVSVTSVQLAPVLENLCIRVASPQCRPHTGALYVQVFPWMSPQVPMQVLVLVLSPSTGLGMSHNKVASNPLCGMWWWMEWTVGKGNKEIM